MAGGAGVGRGWNGSWNWGLAVAVLGAALLMERRGPERPLLAGSGDRAGESILTTGVVHSIRNPVTHQVMNVEVVYLLDYKSGRLLANLPQAKQTGNRSQVLGRFQARDLVRDFRIAPGSTPKFMMTTGALLNEGWEPLYVVETTTSQMAVYRFAAGVDPTSPESGELVGGRLELIEMRDFSEGGAG